MDLQPHQCVVALSSLHDEKKKKKSQDCVDLFPSTVTVCNQILGEVLHAEFKLQILRAQCI